MSVLVVTSVGDIVVDLYTDRCPLTCKNFLKLCKIKYYNGCLFHTVQKDFTAQTGDPTGTGTGGDSIYKFLYGEQARFFSDEIHLDLKHSKTGMIGMASAGENLNASQFYFTLRDDLDYLDGKHTVFGEIAEGLETLTRINEAYIDEKHRPYKNIRIKHTYILDDPFEDPPQLAALVPGASPEGKPKDEVADDVRLEDDWVPMDEQFGPGEIEEILQDKKARESAVLLETIGDIPDAEIKPPDNVLFVCKLNPVTEDEDLHTIFSRFGTCVSADIIRDYKTGDSLCYAFIEFETTESCQEAYFKMDNALIDDRRIHVDFSQSVAKLWSQYRHKDNPGAKGRGCFKCGAPDHMAKDCNGGPATVPQSRKYILRDINTQHGGDDNSRYDMVFDGDTSENPRHEKTHSSPDKADINTLKMHATNQGLKARDPEKKVSGDRSRGSDRNRGGREEEHRHEIKDGQYSEVRRDKEGYLNRRKVGKEYDDYGRGGHRKEHASGKDDRDYRKRSSDSASHVEKKKESGDYRKRHEYKDYRKRNADDDHRGDLVDDRDHRKRHADDGRRDGRREDREGKRHSEESDYRKRNADDDHRGDLVDDRDHRKRRADDGRREYREGKRHSEESEYGQQRDGDKRRYGDRRR